MRTTAKTNHALKIENVDIDINIADGIVDALKEFARDLGFRDERIDVLECRRRDGFIPHSHNLGGIECIAFRDQYTAEMNGTGFENADETLEKYRKFDEYRQADSEATVLYSMDCMYTGIERGIHSVNLRICVSVKDAPYHRQYDDLIEVDLTFRTLKGLEAKLSKLLKRVDLKCFENNLTEAY